jgi:hypothetical protein
MGGLRELEALRRLLSPKDDTTRCDDLLRRMTVPDDHCEDDAPRSGHRTCSSSIVDCHPASLVIATLLRHPLRGHPASLVIATLLRHPLRGKCKK